MPRLSAIAARLALVVALLGLAHGDAQATLPVANGQAILTITPPSGGTAVDVDFAGLESLGTREVVTETPWTEGPVRFEGVLLRDLIDAVAPGATTIRATAINDYTVDIPVEDARTWDVILATRADGERMRIRDKGPLWVIYPWSDVPSLNEARYHNRSIWQVKSIELH